MNPSMVLAATPVSSLALIAVGVVVVVVLIAAVVVGSRRTARARRAADVPARTREGAGDADQRGETWQTIDDDPDQGNPHR
ncbi:MULTISPECIES: DUF6479 family protein [unclassified Streptomyces]|uniref:DUF6479 family protein n=1 Tax=unclassified Streptomyces TaxID=2593676 RepID=UPI0032522437